MKREAASVWFCVACTVTARDTVVSDPQHARKLGRASYIVSSVGILVTVVIFVIVIAVVFAAGCGDGYNYDGTCYRHKSSWYYSRSECVANDGVYDDGYCFYN